MKRDENMVMGTGNGLSAIAVLVSPNDQRQATTTQLATLLNMVGQRFQSVSDEDGHVISAETTASGVAKRTIRMQGRGNIDIEVIPGENILKIDGSNLAPDVWKTITVGDDSVDAEGIDDELQFVGSNGVSVTLNTTTKTITISGAALETAINNLSTSKQDKSDNGLNTTSKQIVGAINEVLAAITSESNTRAAADTALSTAITAETQRATNAEGVITNALYTETQRAQGVETSLQQSVNAKQDKTDNNLQTTSKTIVGAINELKNGGSGSGIPDVPDSKKYVRTQGQWAEGMTKTEITAAIGVEKTRAENAESALSGRIDTADAAISAEVSRATAAEGVNAAAISAEETRAEGAESALGLRIDGVSGDIDAEEAARAAADTALGLRIDSKGDTPTTKTAWESDNTPVDNTIYNLGTTAALTIAATPTSNSMGVAIYFTSGATATTFSYPVTTKWVLSEAPTIEANKEYCITILDGVYNCIEVTTLTHN